MLLLSGPDTPSIKKLQTCTESSKFYYDNYAFTRLCFFYHFHMIFMMFCAKENKHKMVIYSKI